MLKIELGISGLSVSNISLGCMQRQLTGGCNRTSHQYGLRKLRSLSGDGKLIAINCWNFRAGRLRNT